MAARTAAAEPRPEKVAVVTEVRQRLSSSNGALLTEYRGLKVADLARLRHALQQAGGEYGIYKNTLARLAAVDLGLDDMVDLLVGPTAIAFVTGDPVAVAKSLRDFAKTNPNLTVKGGLLGKKVLTAAEAGALADVAPREVVLAQLAGALAGPLVKMAGLLQALPRNFAYGLKALLDQKAASEPAPEPPPAPEAAPDAAEAELPSEAPAETVDTTAPSEAAAPSETPEASAPTLTSDTSHTTEAPSDPAPAEPDTAAPAETDPDPAATAETDTDMAAAEPDTATAETDTSSSPSSDTPTDTPTEETQES